MVWPNSLGRSRVESQFTAVPQQFEALYKIDLVGGFFWLPFDESSEEQAVSPTSPSPQVQPSIHSRGLLNTDSLSSSRMSARAPSCYHAYSMGTEASIGDGIEKIGLVFKGLHDSPILRACAWGYGGTVLRRPTLRF